MAMSAPVLAPLSEKCGSDDPQSAEGRQHTNSIVEAPAEATECGLARFAPNEVRPAVERARQTVASVSGVESSSQATSAPVVARLTEKYESDEPRPAEARQRTDSIVETSTNTVSIDAAESGLDVRASLGDMESIIEGPLGNMDVMLRRLEILTSALVVISAISLFVDVELTGQELARALESPTGSELDLASRSYFRVFEQIVNGVFVFELAFRLYKLRARFFWNHLTRRFDAMNGLDFVIVIVCSIDLYLLPLLFGEASGSIQSMRILRLLRLTRALRVVRVMTTFSKLRILLLTTASSFMSLFWSMVLVCLIIYGSALALCQTLQTSVLDQDLPLDLRLWLFQWYGSGSRSLWTMFLVTFSGGWPNYVQRLIDEVHWTFSLIFVAYVWVVVFAITRIITALFLKDTLQVASDDAEMMAREQRSAKVKMARKLEKLFALVDTSQDGYISIDEFRNVVQLPTAQLYFTALDLQIGQACDLFALLDNGDGKVDLDEFCEGVMRLKGQARAVDMIVVMRDCTAIARKVAHLETLITELAELSIASASKANAASGRRHHAFLAALEPRRRDAHAPGSQHGLFLTEP
eukprot:CAMPEP_0176040438 /NCGR_PEP_ID=MMETSP0120_2-20121206/20051_1 /TAXON_ID=160619 /ORGANISM="Kryptoperidinium foliaceum, Strain CCMP 1326" /LENGTH=582 /DNA_ID=CAMNT_0017373835 /DNA_START=12 /DNA_END=1757 /DNA_ORIENTATION=-